MTAPNSPSFTCFETERCIRILGPSYECYLPIDPRQNVDILAEISKADYLHDPHHQLFLIRTQTEGAEYSAVDGVGGALYHLASTYVPYGCACRFDETVSFGGVFWRVIGHTTDAPTEPVQVQACEDEDTARALCATFQAMLEAYQNAKALIEADFGPEVPERTQQTVLALKRLHPEMYWAPYPLEDYAQYAELDAPDLIISFGKTKDQLIEGLVDAYSTYYGSPCGPEYWGLSAEAAQILQRHNRVYINRYPKGDGPKTIAAN